MDERATRQRDEWLLMHTLRRTWWHITEGWSAVEPQQRRRWMLTMAVGLVLLLALTIMLVVVTRSLDRSGALAWEPAFVRAFAKHAPLSFSLAIWVESPGNGVVLWPLVLVSAAIAAWQRQTLLALTIAGGFVLLDAAILTGWQLWERARPDLIAGGIASSRDSFSAFPSGHVSQTIVVYGLLAALWLRRTHLRAEKVFGWCVVAILTVAVAAGRLRLGAHWPTDLVGGAILGIVWLGVLLRASRSTRPRYEPAPERTS